MPTATLLKALADDSRLRILRVLAHGAFHVNELVAILRMGQSRVSRHLRILSDAGLVRARREGSCVYYTLSAAWSGDDDGRQPGRRFLRVLGRELEAERDPEREADDAGVRRCLDARRERAERFFRGVAGSWDAQRDAVQGPPEHLDRLVAALEGAETIVDLGTGTGVLLERLAATARRVIGIDATAEMLAVARRHSEAAGLSNVELRLGALEHLPVRNAEADAMVANMVLHHVADPPAALREISRALKPRGRFVLADLTAHGDEAYRERLGDLWLGFEPSTLRSWLEDADFDIDGFDIAGREVDPERRDSPAGEVEESAGVPEHPEVILVTARRRASRSRRRAPTLGVRSSGSRREQPSTEGASK